MVTKRVVLKEEIRIRKRIVEDEEEVVEVDLRKEEVEIEDRTKYGEWDPRQGPLAPERS